MDERLELILEGNDDRPSDSSTLRTVVIHRGERGYGFTVSGESPVIVQDVKDGGPAAQAGVRKGDSIIEVNGAIVSQINHKEVVQIIKSANQCVKLTLQSCPEGEALTPQDGSHRHLAHTTNPSKYNDRITAPLPVNTQLQNQMEANKSKMLTKYLEKQRRVRDNIVLELQRGPSKVLQRNLEKELDSINRQIAKIQEELKTVKDSEAQLHSQTRSSPRSPPLSRPSFSLPHSHHHHHHHPTHSRSVSDIPPPLPARNRPLVSQTSAPNISTSSISSSSSVSLASAPPLPPRLTLERVGEGGLAQSLENIPKGQCLSHSASSVSEPGSRPPSHYRARSSPDPLGLQSSHGFQSGSDCVNDVSVYGPCGSRGKVPSATFSDDTISTTTSIHEPPGTPPPPYASTSQLCPSDEVDENNISIPDDCDGGGDYPPTAPPLPPPPGSCLPSRPTLPGLPPKLGSHPASPFSSQVTSPTSPNGQVVSPQCTVVPSPSQPILSMEDEEFSDTETLEDHGPFQSLSKLWNHNAYLAVFMNYVISNCDSSSLFFYVITHLYKEGVGKDMKRWAYEITSSFLLPGAPLRLCNVEENILHEIDETLQNELDKEEILRKVFWKARMRCREDLNEQLADFRNKRSAGLGSIFGPADHLLEESKYNKAKELQIVEHLLVPCLESVSDDLKNATDQMLVTVSSLATILLKYFMVRSQQAQQLIDRCPLYVSKERPLRTKIFRGNKKQVFRDHHFNQHTYYSVTYCNHCGLIIWGIAPQGYQCANCEMNIHKSCAKQVEEVCIGQLHKKDRSRDTRFSAILGKIISDDRETKRKVSQVNAAQIDKARRGFEEGNIDPCGLPSETDNYTGEKGSNAGAGGAGGVAALSSPASTTSPATTNNAHSAAHPGLASSSTSDLPNNGSDAHEEYGSPDPASPGLGPPDPSPPVKHHKKKEGQVNRSESLKEKQPRRKRTRENRKHSDPNIPTSKSGDVDADSSLIPDNSGSSSNSSLSPSLESPSHSLEHVSREAPLPAPVLENDSDIECEVDLPNWQKLVSSDEIKKLKPKERKRQDTISELFHTERTHVRVLKVLKHLFQVPMSEAGLLSKQQLDLLFPNLDEILEIHVIFNQAMKKRRIEEPIVSRVGDVLINMFDGEQGDFFQQQAAEFVRSQFTALENLKQQQKRDQRLANFLQEQENNPVCRRLQLKDMLPCVVQRLSKYPLLIELLLSYTDSSAQPEEYEQLSRSLERSKEILAFVNTAVQEAENSQRLHELQRKLDQSSLAKNKHGHLDELKGHLELTKHRLIYEGQLTWRVAKGQKNIDLQVLMLDEFIVLLQKADDKYILKNHSISKSPVKDENKLTHSPIIKYGPSMLFRAVATDNCAFFIVTTQTVGPHIYELVASSPMERKVWFRHIQEAQEAYTAREGRNRRAHPHTPLQDPDDSTTSSSDALRDVDDGVEVDGGEATDTTTESLVDSKTQQGAAKPSESSGRIEESPAPVIPTQPPSSPETLVKKTAEAGGSGSSGSGPGGPSPTAGRSPASGRRLQEVQIIQIVEGPTLIQPSEVKVSQGVVLSAEPVLTPIELLRRKDLKIRQALEEKQQIIANILNIPYEDFESVVDMAGEPAIGNKEPKELVLAAMFQAKCLQESLNEALNLTEGDIVAARANEGKATGTPLYQAPMTKLMNISTTLSQQLSSLLNLVSERDDERERMRKELVASRERLHLLHMRQNSASSQTVVASTQAQSSSTQPSTSSPYTSRPSSFVSVTSSVADNSDTSLQHDTDDDGTEVSKGSNIQQEARASDTRDEPLPENFEDAGSRSELTDTKPSDAEASGGLQEGEEGTRGSEEASAT